MLHSVVLNHRRLQPERVTVYHGLMSWRILGMTLWHRSAHPPRVMLLIAWGRSVLTGKQPRMTLKSSDDPRASQEKASKRMTMELHVACSIRGCCDAATKLFSKSSSSCGDHTTFQNTLLFLQYLKLHLQECASVFASGRSSTTRSRQTNLTSSVFAMQRLSCTIA